MTGGSIDTLWGAAAPMLASGPPDPIVPPDGPHWSFEVKWDGVRALALVRAEGTARLRSRNGNDLADRYPAIATPIVGEALAPLTGSAILDGECVAFDSSGHPSFFQALHGGQAVRFACFDVLAWQGEDVRARPVEDRRALLAALDLERLTGGVWQPSPVFSDGPALMAATAEQGMEGVVAKRAGSPYRAGVRSDDWVKLPHRRTVSLVVVGWLPRRSGTGVGSLVVADAQRVLLGSVGSGISERLSSALRPVLHGIERSKPEPDLRIGPGREPWLRDVADRVHWVEPALVVDVRHLGHTDSGGLRQAVVVRMRPDLDLADMLGGPW